ncbi:MAG: hypothetical protein Q7R52_00805 [archaeon]|nr:hypothetical protein [archaeon]
MEIKILTESEKKKITNQLKEQFGIEYLDGTLIRLGKERIMLFTGEIERKWIETIYNNLHIEGIGLYIGKEQDDGIRLSIEGAQLFKEQIKKNIFELEDHQVDDWMKGRQLDIQTGKKGFFVMKYKNDFLGTGKFSEEKIGNFIPKERRLKEKS